MMIAINKKYVNEIPLLEIVQQVNLNKSLPTIIYFHGITSAKEQNLAQAYLLAEKGYRVLLPDSLHHGERDTIKDPEKIQYDFWKIIFTSVKELKTLYDWVNDEGLLENERLAIAGTSMGGITVAAALTQYDFIKTAGIMMGTAKLGEMSNYLLDQIEKQGIKLPFKEEELQQLKEQIRKIDLSEQIDTLKNRPLFIWHGDADVVVPYRLTKAFVDQLKVSNYPEENYQFITEKDRDHKVSRVAMLQLRDWIVKHL